MFICNCFFQIFSEGRSIVIFRRLIRMVAMSLFFLSLLFFKIDSVMSLEYEGLCLGDMSGGLLSIDGSGSSSSYSGSISGSSHTEEACFGQVYPIILNAFSHDTSWQNTVSDDPGIYQAAVGGAALIIGWGSGLNLFAINSNFKDALLANAGTYFLTAINFFQLMKLSHLSKAYRIFRYPGSNKKDFIVYMVSIPASAYFISPDTYTSGKGMIIVVDTIKEYFNGEENEVATSNTTEIAYDSSTDLEGYESLSSSGIPYEAATGLDEYGLSSQEAITTERPSGDGKISIYDRPAFWVGAGLNALAGSFVGFFTLTSFIYDRVDDLAALGGSLLHMTKDAIGLPQGEYVSTYASNMFEFQEKAKELLSIISSTSELEPYYGASVVKELEKIDPSLFESLKNLLADASSTSVDTTIEATNLVDSKVASSVEEMTNLTLDLKEKASNLMGAYSKLTPSEVITLAKGEPIESSAIKDFFWAFGPGLGLNVAASYTSVMILSNIFNAGNEVEALEAENFKLSGDGNVEFPDGKVVNVDQDDFSVDQEQASKYELVASLLQKDTLWYRSAYGFQGLGLTNVGVIKPGKLTVNVIRYAKAVYQGNNPYVAKSVIFTEVAATGFSFGLTTLYAKGLKGATPSIKKAGDYRKATGQANWVDNMLSPETQVMIGQAVLMSVFSFGGGGLIAWVLKPGAAFTAGQIFNVVATISTMCHIESMLFGWQ